MDKIQAKHHIITATLPHIAFDGWTMAALKRGAADAGYSTSDLIRVYGDNVTEAVNDYFTMGDAALTESLKNHSLSEMKIRDKIMLCVTLRIQQHATYPEALRRAQAYYMLPNHIGDGLKSLYHTVDYIWYSIGDTSTDFNFYTKRATLAAVYSATVNYWLNDTSDDKQDTWDYLRRRIENVMQIETLKAKFKQAIL